jgi:hypothetical protein
VLGSRVLFIIVWSRVVLQSGKREVWGWWGGLGLRQIIRGSEM